MLAFVAAVSLTLVNESRTQLTKEVFKKVMLEDAVLSTFGQGLAEKVEMFREAMFALRMNYMVLRNANLPVNEMMGVIMNGSKDLPLRQRLLLWLDPVVIFVILLNAISIGLSYDLDGHDERNVWRACEVAFAVFFIFELIVKIKLAGFMEHFAGVDWAWNCFDFCLVLGAVFDAVRSVYEIIADASGDEGLIGKLTVLRTLRLFRLSRMVRLVRWKPLRELRLMVVGLVSGAKTLVWAILLLMVICYVLALLCRELELDDTQDLRRLQPMGNSTQGTDSDDGDNYEELFRNVPDSMFTVYRCFIGDCADQGGRPLAVAMSEKHGWFFNCGYIAATMLVTLGLFNLIMAIFVENTLYLAKLDERKRKENVIVEKMRVAKMVSKLVSRIVRKAHDNDHQVSVRPIGLLRHFRRVQRYLWPNTREEEEHTCSMARVEIERSVFELAMSEPDMLEILEELDICVEDTSKVFDTLDSNGDGSLQMNELVEGLMQMRGPADKLDMMQMAVTVRQMQVSVKELQRALHHKMETTQARELPRLPPKATRSFK